MPITVKKIRATNLTKGLCNLLEIFLNDGFRIPDVDGEIKEVE